MTRTFVTPLIRNAVAAALCLTLAAPAGAQDRVDVTLEDARVIAVEAAIGGDPELSIVLAQGLLQADSNDRAAHLALAAALPQVGRAADGRAAGARAFALSNSPIQRYEAARVTALAAANNGQLTLATLWLRRALIHAPTARDTEQTLADAARLSRLNPWSTTLRFSVTPSGNVNGGTDEKFTTFQTIGFVQVDDLGEVYELQVVEFSGPNSTDALALSGVVGRFGFDTSYRLFETETSRARIALSYSGSRVWLSPEAKRISPTSRGSDFSSDVADISFGYDRILGGGATATEVTLGTVRYDGDPYYDFARLSLSYGRPVDEASTLRITGFSEYQAFAAGNDRDIRRNGLRLSYGRRLANGDAISAQFGITDANSDNNNAISTEMSAQGSWSPNRQFGPARLRLTAGVSREEFPEYGLFLFQVLDGRQDTSVFAGIDLSFPDVQYAGFSPVVSLSSSRTRSNVSRFTTDDLSISLNFRSAF